LPFCKKNPDCAADPVSAGLTSGLFDGGRCGKLLTMTVIRKWMRECWFSDWQSVRSVRVAQR